MSESIRTPNEYARVPNPSMFPPTHNIAGFLNPKAMGQVQDKALAQLAAQFEDFRNLHAECKISGGPAQPEPPEITPEAQEQIDHLKVRRGVITSVSPCHTCS